MFSVRIYPLSGLSDRILSLLLGLPSILPRADIMLANIAEAPQYLGNCKSTPNISLYRTRNSLKVLCIPILRCIKTFLLRVKGARYRGT